MTKYSFWLMSTLLLHKFWNSSVLPYSLASVVQLYTEVVWSFRNYERNNILVMFSPLTRTPRNSVLTLNFGPTSLKLTASHFYYSEHLCWTSPSFPSLPSPFPPILFPSPSFPLLAFPSPSLVNSFFPPHRGSEGALRCNMSVGSGAEPGPQTHFDAFTALEGSTFNTHVVATSYPTFRGRGGVKPSS